MINEQEFIELHVAYPGHPWVALIDGLHVQFGLNRVWFELHKRRRWLSEAGGTQEQIYRLPVCDAIWEVKENVNGQDVRRFVAVRDGDPRLHRLTRDVVERVAEKSMTLEQAIEACKHLPIGPDYDTTSEIVR